MPETTTLPTMRRPRLLAVSAVRDLASLERRNRRPWSAVSAWQDQQLALTVDQALGTRMGAERSGLAAVRTRADLPAIPTINKGDLRRRPMSDWTTAEVPEGSRTVWSTGTSAEPLAIPYPPVAAWRQGVLALHIHLHQGIPPWTRRLVLGGLPDEQRGRGPVRTGVMAATTIAVDSRDPAAIAERVAERRPGVLFGPSRELIMVGAALTAENRPGRIATSGEVLTPENKATLRELFGVDPLDTYGMSEAGRIASQCRERDLYHVHHDTLVIEVIDDDGRQVAPGESGDLVVTTLWNPLVPLVRYRTGDRVTLADRPCRCGHDHPAFTSIDGRTMDWFVDDRGRRVAPQRLWLSMHAPDALRAQVERYRIVQAKDRSTRVEIVSVVDLDPAHATATAESYRSVLGVATEVIRVPELRSGRGGRFRAFTSAATPEPPEVSG